MTIQPATLARPYNRVPHIEELGELAALLLNTPFLAVDEERDLAERAKAGDKVAFDKLVKAHMRLVVSMARKYAKGGMPFGDLVQEGNIGLIEAVRRFEVEKGFRLSTYAGWWIRSYIQSFAIANRSLVKLGTTAEQKRMFFSLNKARSRLESQGLAPGQVDERLAAEFGVTTAQIVGFEARARRRVLPQREGRRGRRSGAAGPAGRFRGISGGCAGRKRRVRPAPGPSRRGPGDPERQGARHPAGAPHPERHEDAGRSGTGLRRDARAHPADRGQGLG